MPSKAAGIGPGEQCPQHQEAEREGQAVGQGAYGGWRGRVRGLGLAATAWAQGPPAPNPSQHQSLFQ